MGAARQRHTLRHYRAETATRSRPSAKPSTYRARADALRCTRRRRCLSSIRSFRRKDSPTRLQASFIISLPSKRASGHASREHAPRLRSSMPQRARSRVRASRRRSRPPPPAETRRERCQRLSFPRRRLLGLERSLQHRRQAYRRPFSLPGFSFIRQA